MWKIIAIFLIPLTTFFVKNNAVESISIESTKENFLELEEIFISIEINSNEKKGFQIRNLDDYYLKLELESEKSKKIYDLSLRDFIFSKRNILRRYQSINNLDSLNLEKLTGVLEVGNHKCRIFVPSKSKIKNFLGIGKITSNWLEVNVFRANSCENGLKTFARTEKEIDQNLIISSIEKQSGGIINNNSIVEYRVENISKDTFAIQESSIIHYQDYWKLSDDCEWEKRSYFKSAGCPVGRRIKTIHFYPNSITKMEREINSGQGVYILRNEVINLSTKVKDTIQTKPIIINGYNQELIKKSRFNNTYYDF